jgi:hypothetical protein
MGLKLRIVLAIAGMGVFAIVMVGVQAILGAQVPRDPPIVPGEYQLNATFHKSDFAYGPQAWKPYYTRSLPIMPDQNAVTGEVFYLMFIDLNATPFGMIMDNVYCNGVKVEYSFTDLTGLAAFHAYGFCRRSNALGSTPGAYLTNRVNGLGASGYYVWGTSGKNGTAPETQRLNATNDIRVRVANPEGPAIDSYGDGKYRLLFRGEGSGVNAMHLTTDLSVPFGQITYTDNQSGVFHITNTGGSGNDNTILMVAVNGTLPDTFALHIRASYNLNGTVTT